MSVYVPSLHKRLADARIASGREPKEVAIAVGLSIPAYYDLESHDDDVLSAVSIKELIGVCKFLRMPVTSLFAGGSRPDNLKYVGSYSALADEVRQHLRLKGEPLEVFEEKVGWSISNFLERPETIEESPIDCLNALCGELAVDWVRLLSNEVGG